MMITPLAIENAGGIDAAVAAAVADPSWPTVRIRQDVFVCCGSIAAAAVHATGEESTGEPPFSLNIWIHGCQTKISVGFKLKERADEVLAVLQRLSAVAHRQQWRL